MDGQHTSPLPEREEGVGDRVYDGSGLPSYNADVALSDRRIIEIGRLNGPAKRTIDVTGLAVAPGFIDPHTHLDAQLLWDPLGTSSCYHGVTTVVVGNCGLSLAPAKPEDRDAVIKSFVRVEAISRRVLEEGVQWKWTSTGEYLDVLGTKLGINAAALVGQAVDLAKPEAKRKYVFCLRYRALRYLSACNLR